MTVDGSGAAAPPVPIINDFTAMLLAWIEPHCAVMP